ncbi:hypothetical protein R6Q59_016273 [Mikania micrantha]
MVSMVLVPMFEQMDDHLLDAMCDRLKLVLYTKNSYLMQEGDPAREMLFITHGEVESITTNGGKAGFYNYTCLKAGDFCGEELFTWALDPKAKSQPLPFSTRTVKTLTNVQAFALVVDELLFVASQFRRLHSRVLQHTFRFYSQQWRTWAACFIQATWRRYCKMKKEKRLQEALATGSETATLSIGASIYVSRFSSNAISILWQNQMYNAKASTPVLGLIASETSTA